MAGCAQNKIAFKSKSQSIVFEAEIAKTDQARARGLMFRETLAERSGMLFLYEAPQRVAFWMRNTPIALDMIFMDDAGQIKHIHSNARPFDETVIEGGTNIFAVFEINAGLARRFGLTKGDYAQHPSFDQNASLLPCG